MGKVAFITGGNGITGSAILEYLVSKTQSDEWSHIIVTSRSPLKTLVHDPRIEFMALDFSEDAQALASKMRGVCGSVTHAYFSSYVHQDDFTELNKANQALFDNFLGALLRVAPNLENCTLQTGGKYYYLHLQPVSSPAREGDARVKSKINNFYFSQEDALATAQKGQKWSWNVIRPQAIIGHTLKPNGMNSALTYALYILVCKELGTEAKMPTNQIYWSGFDEVSDSRLIADLTIFASTSPKCANQAFNVTNGDCFTWRYMWPRLAEYFGATTTSEQVFTKPLPTVGTTQQDLNLEEWAKDKREIWNKVCDKAGVPSAKAAWDAGTWAFQDWVFQRTWSVILSMDKAREYGWMGQIDSFKSFTDRFQKFEELGQIPSSK